MGEVHQYLEERGDVDYCVLRLTWFMENFTDPLARLYGIRELNTITTAAGDEVAFRALTDERSPNGERIIIGPEAYNYDEVAGMITQATGRKITHIKMTHGEAVKYWRDFGLPQDYAEYLLKLEIDAAEGIEQAFLGREDKQVGKKHLWEYFRDPEVQKQLIKQ